MSPKPETSLLLTIIITIIAITFLLPSSMSSLEFVYNTDFNSTNVLLYGSSIIESSILTLTNDTTFSIGRALYPKNVRTKHSFFTSFIFSMAPHKNSLPGHGFAFAFLPFTGIQGANSAQHLGIFNFTNNGDPGNHIFAVEFDVFKNEEFQDINDNHVGIDVNSLNSVASDVAGFWGGEDDREFNELVLNNGVNYQVWIDYDNSMIVNVSMAKTGAQRPKKPLISQFVNLSSVLLDEMYVGFAGSTGRLVQSHRILAWSFSNSNFSIGDALITSNLPSFVAPRSSIVGIIIGVSVGGVIILALGVALYVVLYRSRIKRLRKEDVEDWELEYWPRRIEYQELYAATKGFSDENVVGVGGHGKVYRGVLAGASVAVKRINTNNMREFLAEVSSLGRLKHRNLVGLRGWCKKDKGSLLLVYDYMENGSIDKKLFDPDENSTFSWAERVKALKDVATGVLYLHEEWESKVLHRDIKASNVLLDKDMNARLGDFGLAWVHNHQKALESTTHVVGTVGYMAPEVIATGRSSTQTDVYGFGILILEVVYGRRPVEYGKPNLVDWLWSLMEKGELSFAVDDRLKATDGFSSHDVERILQLGLLCAYPDPRVRPTMRQITHILDGMRNEESEGEEIFVNLLDRIRTSTLQNTRSRGYPTFEELQINRTLSMSITNSDRIVEGR